MIRHIVFFRYTDVASEEDRKQKTDYLKGIFSILPDKIPQIQGYRVGENLSRRENAWDLVIDSDFISLRDLEDYRNHPAHVEAVQQSSAVKKVSAVVDYEL